VLPWVALGVGTAASLAANVAVGGHDLIGRALAGWPAVALLVSIKLLFSMFDHADYDRSAVPDDQRPSAPGAAVRGTAVPNGHRDATPGAPVDIRAAVADLTPAARTARAALVAEGRPLSRDALAERMRDDGHAVSNARASLLLKILRADEASPDDNSSDATNGGHRGADPSSEAA